MCMDRTVQVRLGGPGRTPVGGVLPELPPSFDFRTWVTRELGLQPGIVRPL